jgi:hypothetical protein
MQLVYTNAVGLGQHNHDLYPEILVIIMEDLPLVIF